MQKQIGKQTVMFTLLTQSTVLILVKPENYYINVKKKLMRAGPQGNMTVK